MFIGDFSILKLFQVPIFVGPLFWGPPMNKTDAIRLSIGGRRHPPTKGCTRRLTDMEVENEPWKPTLLYEQGCSTSM